MHEIIDPGWLDEMADTVRRTIEPGRHIHLVLENEKNEASHLHRDIDAQWNDDGHHAFHVLLTGEDRGYYKDYAEAGAAGLARVMAEGFFFQGQTSSHRDRRRGTPSKDLPPTAFVLFLQNHDQIGNRAFGERLTQLADPAALEAAIAAQMLCPQIPMLFMGEEDASCARRSCSLPTITRNWATPSARDAARNSPTFPNSPTRRSASESPIRIHRRHSRPQSRSPIRNTGRRGASCIAS